MSTYEQVAFDNIIKIEKCMNSLMLKEKYRQGSVAYKFSDSLISDESNNDDINKLKDMMRTMRMRKDLDFLDTHLRMRGYVRDKGKNIGEINYALFRDEADITQSVWSRYATGTQTRTDHDTLLKIILGLRLNEADAHYFLSLTGSGFAVATDMIDRIVLSYIMSDYLGDISTVDIVNTVMFLLDFYSEQEEKAGRKPLRRLYKL